MPCWRLATSSTYSHGQSHAPLPFCTRSLRTKFRSELFHVRVLADQVVRDDALLAIGDFIHVLARPEPRAVAVLHAVVEDEVLRLDQRLGHVDRVPRVGDVREEVAVTEEMLRQRRLVALGQTVAPDPALLDMCRVDREHVAFELAGREAFPRMRGELRRMRTAVHPDRPRLLVRADVVLDGDEDLRVRIALFPNPQLQRTTIDVRGDMHLTLMLGERQPRWVPAEGPLTRAVVNRQP